MMFDSGESSSTMIGTVVDTGIVTVYMLASMPSFTE